MKTYQILLLTITMITIYSCHKEQLEFSPTEMQLQKMDFKANPKNLPPDEQDCFYVWYEGMDSNNPGTSDRATVNFQGQIWSLVLNTDTASGHRAGITEMWSSDNGKHWTLRKTNPFSGKKNASLIVHNDRLWVLGGVDGRNRFLIDVWSSANGIDWRLESLAPFNLGNSGSDMVTIFRNKIFVFTRWYTDRNILVHSSSDGKHWNLETANAFGTYPDLILKPVVFENKLFVIGTHTTTAGIIFESTDGKIWGSRGFSNYETVGFSVTKYKGLVWRIGGFFGKSGTDDIVNRIWYTSDMRTWTEYNPKAKFGSTVFDVDMTPFYRHTALPFDDGLLIFGGRTGVHFPEERSYNHKVWTIYEDCIEEAK